MPPADRSITEQLDRLGIILPPPPSAVAAYEPWVRSGRWILTSGQLPWVEGRIVHPGRCGAEVTVEQAYQAARACALNALAQLLQVVGDLDHVRRILKVDGYVHAAPGFRGHPQVLNGASDLFNEVFAGRGGHARLAIGVNEMPLDAPVQICVTAETD